MPSSNRDRLEHAPLDADAWASAVATDDLARLAQSGDARAFAVLASRFRPRLLAALNKRLGGRYADAEDIAQDALTKAWCSITSYDANRSFASWLYTIAFRRSTDHMRFQQRQHHLAQQLPSPEATDGSAAQSLIAQETKENLWAIAKQRLSDTQYVALWLRYAEDLSIRETARAIGKSQVATRVLLHRARAELQQHLGTGDEGD